MPGATLAKDMSKNRAAHLRFEEGWYRLTVSNSALKARLVSTLEAKL
jgi:hypothetical protein